MYHGNVNTYGFADGTRGNSQVARSQFDQSRQTSRRRPDAHRDFRRVNFWPGLSIRVATIFASVRRQPPTGKAVPQRTGGELNMTSQTIRWGRWVLLVALLLISTSGFLRAYELPRCRPCPRCRAAGRRVGRDDGCRGVPEVKDELRHRDERAVRADVVVHRAKHFRQRTSAWLRQAKFGIWFHYGPQAQLASGDWSAQQHVSAGRGVRQSPSAYGHPARTATREVINSLASDELQSRRARLDVLQRWRAVSSSCGACIATTSTTGTRNTIRGTR